MKAFLLYIGEVNIYLTVLAAVYYLFLRRSPRFVLNRAILLTGIAAAFALPAVPAPHFLFAEGAGPAPGFLRLPEIAVGGEENMLHSEHFFSRPVFWLFAIYLAGVIGFGLHFFRRLLHTLRQCRQAVRSEDGIRRVTLSENMQAASFFRTLFLPSRLRDENEALIRAHEAVHMRERHTADLLFTEIVKIISWFNPAAHYLSAAAEMNNEFRADRVAAAAARDKITYGKVLIAEALGANHSLIAHPFLKPETLKTRIAMLTRKTDRKSALNYLAIIPALALAVFVHSCTEAEPEMPDQKTEASESKKNPDIRMIEDSVPIPQKGEDGIYTVVEDMPEFPGGFSALMAFLGEEMKYPEGAKDDGAEGTVFISFTIDEEGLTKDPVVLNAAVVDERLAAEALRTVGKMPAWTPGRQAGEKVSVKYNLPVRFQLAE